MELARETLICNKALETEADALHKEGETWATMPSRFFSVAPWSAQPSITLSTGEEF
jgi:hypothetical protein